MNTSITLAQTRSKLTMTMKSEYEYLLKTDEGVEVELLGGIVLFFFFGLLNCDDDDYIQSLLLDVAWLLGLDNVTANCQEKSNPNP